MTRPLLLGLVGPLPPPNGGMAMQTQQLYRLLEGEGVSVHMVQANAPYQPAFVENIRVFRALVRLVQYLWRVGRLARRVDVIHLMSNSGWSWQLYSAPVLWIGWLLKTPVIVNYRGGQAREYLQRSAARVIPSLKKAAKVVVPSGFLEKVFAEVGVETQVVPNIIDLELFQPASGDQEAPGDRFIVVITRNLEPIYGLDTAIRCIALVRKRVPEVVLKIAGSGPQLAMLQALVEELELQDCVSFVGRLGRGEIVSLYQQADAMLNPATVDNMPNSVIEALACGLPVVSTNVGGVPFMVEDGVTALLVEPHNPDAMAQSIIRLHGDRDLQQRLRKAGLEVVKKFTWPVVGKQWLGLYRSQLVTG